MIKCIVFDFDLTLFNSSNLEEFRNTRQWSKVYEKLKECSFYPNALNVISQLKKAGVKIAIATNAPEKYVSQALAFNNVSVDFLVAYHNVKNHKPDPEVIYKILQKFSLSTKDIVYVGDNDIDYNTAKNANVKFFAVDWGVFSEKNIEYINFYNLISTIFDSKIITTTNNDTTHNNEVANNKIDSYTPSDLILHKKNEFFLGYYKDPIKSLLINYKNNQKDIVHKWNNVLIDNISSLPKIDYIVRALGHDETKLKEGSLDSTAQIIADELGAEYIPTLLYKNSASKKSVKLKAYERKREIANKYSINTQHSKINTIKNASATILIVDDVVTTGATTSEIIKTLSSYFPSCKFYIFSLVQTRGFDNTPDMIFHNNKLQQMLNLANSDIKKAPVKFSSKLYKSKNFSANYSYTNHNFIIQNVVNYSINADPLKTKYLPAIFILKNILQRGKPTLMSKFLQSHLGFIHHNTNIFQKAYPLISAKPLQWNRIIKGDDANNYFPAKKFYEILIPKYFNDLVFVKNLLIPEVSIFDITQVYVEELYQQQVDFYLPQASLIIEIDGSQHTQSTSKDSFRDSHTKKYGIKTVRITTQEIELENNSFYNKIEDLKNHIYHSMRIGINRQKADPTYISLSDYQDAYKIGIDLNSPIYKSTAVIRMQLLLLELLENDTLNFNDDWIFEIREHDVKDFAEIAIEDTLLWLSHLMNLLELDIPKIKYHVTHLNSSSDFSSNNSIKIDFSICQRYTDEHQDNPQIIYTRTHYLDQYKYFKPNHATNLGNVEFKDYDYFSMSILDPIQYSLELDGEESDRISLLFLLENIFLQHVKNPDFREGQLSIITNALMQKDTVGLLPTGSGKSVCYQLAAMLQPAISFVVCPIKSLMYDQKADLDQILCSRTNYITSDMRADEKTLVQKEFSHGKYFFIFISPERFQSKGFRKEFSSINQEKSFAYAVIDEVHCLSEWGHDFRTSYLNLANTIERLAPESSYIGLTATASVNVLRDIQSEFNIEDMDVKTPLNYTREELSFNVINDNSNKFNTLKTQLLSLNEKWNIFNPSNTENYCGIIFTPHVNGEKGCYPLS
ncbi:MAG: HAD-IIIA family hydrolase, partial [Campylobacterota bacterium]|nr:HAD-IIIA family hydrolase [Campylobacterota bacterium]